MLQIYFVCLTYLLIVTDTVRCKPDYIFNYDVGGWLKLHTIPATWEEAMLRCHYEGAVLASPLNKYLVISLYTLMRQSSVSERIFLGTHDLHSEGDFGSMEGVPLSKMEIRWGAHPKRNHNERCLTMTADRLEYDMYTSSCTEPLPYICYKKFDNHTINECGTFDNEYHLNQRTGSCYKIHKTELTWDRAYSICASEGGHLVILNDKEEASVVKDLYSGHTGLRAWGDDRIWLTIHGERIEDVFHGWHSGEPNNVNNRENVGYFNPDGTLNDGESSHKAHFLCEKSPKSIQFGDLLSRRRRISA